jgi:hypothetical protein
MKSKRATSMIGLVGQSCLASWTLTESSSQMTLLKSSEASITIQSILKTPTEFRADKRKEACGVWRHANFMMSIECQNNDFY